MTSCIVNILDEELHDSVVNSLIQDLDKFGVTDVRVCCVLSSSDVLQAASSLEDIAMGAALDPEHACYLICSAEAAHSVRAWPQHHLTAASTLLLICASNPYHP